MSFHEESLFYHHNPSSLTLVLYVKALLHPLLSDASVNFQYQSVIWDYRVLRSHIQVSLVIKENAHHQTRGLRAINSDSLHE